MDFMQPTVKRWTEPVSGIACAIRQYPGRAWCGYVRVPPGVDADEVTPHGGWNGVFEDMCGFDMGHGQDIAIVNGEIVYFRTEDDVTAEVTRVARALATIRDTNSETKAVETWPRWDDQGTLARRDIAAITLILRDNSAMLGGGGDILVGIRKEFKPRSESLMWWVMRPKYLSRRAQDMNEVSAILRERGIKPIPPRLLAAFNEWKPIR